MQNAKISRKADLSRRLLFTTPIALAACGGEEGGSENDQDSGQHQVAYMAYSAFETREAPAGVYAGEPFPATLVSWQPAHVPAFDVNGDGRLDLIVPVRVGYRTSVDSRGPTLFFENVNGRLTVVDNAELALPITTGSRNASLLWVDSIGSQALVTAHTLSSPESDDFYNQYTSAQQAEKVGYLTIIAAAPFGDITSQVLGSARTNTASETGIENAINAHAIATGDINNDGLDDIIAANQFDPLVLLQNPDRVEFTRSVDPFFNVLEDGILDMRISDFNGDGADDLLVGKELADTVIYLNDGSGGFSEQSMIRLQESVYGSESQLHLATFVFDFDNDADSDILVFYSRSNPHYGGNYLELYENIDGETFMPNASLKNVQIDGEIYTDFLGWSGFLSANDIDADGMVDFVLQSASRGGVLTVFKQTSIGEFSRIEIETDFADEIAVKQWQVFALDDFDGDGLSEVAFLIENMQSEGSRSFLVQELPV